MRLQASSNQGTASQGVPAFCLVTDAVKDVVHISGPKIGEYYQVTKVDIDDLGTMPGFGIIIRKLSDTICIVQTSGVVSSVYAGLTPSKPLFVGTDARLTDVVTPHKPTPGSRVLQIMGLALSASDLLLNVESPIILTT
jgi:hypothetical protein